MKKLILGAGLATLAAVMPAAAPAQKLGPAIIAVVDTGRVARECNACKTAQTTLQQQQAQVQQLQQQLTAPLQTEANSLRTAVAALNGKDPDAALKARIDKFQAQQNTANQQLQQRVQTYQSTEQNVLTQINTALGPVLNQVMQARGATAIFGRDAVLTVSPSIDVTNDVLAALNVSLTTISVTPLPQGQQQQTQGR